MAAAPHRTEPWVWIVVLVALVFLVPAIFLMGGWGTGMMGGGSAMGGWGVLGIVMVVVLVVVIVAVVLYAGRETEAWAPPPGAPMMYAPPAPAPAGPQTPIQILDARYARGEITREEYLRMREDLGRSQP